MKSCVREVGSPGSAGSPYWAPGATCDLHEVVQHHFAKQFRFANPATGWLLPNACTLFKETTWQLPQFHQLKVELNQVKSKLNDFYLKEWHAHTRSMNKAGDVLWRLRARVNPEFITQAWCKLYENVSANELVPPSVSCTETFNTVHLCEAPGAFITSLNHYLKLHHPTVRWNWLATTLNPYYEGNPLNCMINDDRFILQTLDRWRFGTDFTGNLMSLENMDHLAAEAAKMGDVLLVTADGSIDCQDDPGEQECHVASLHYCEVVAALTILAPGGSLLVKMFTLYEGQSACLVYLLCCVFHSVTVSKPATSKEGNSEVYLCCRGYAGPGPTWPWLSVLRQHYGPEPKTEALFPKQFVPESFLQQLYSCAKMFKDIQVSVIENNIQAFMFKQFVDWSRVKALRRMVADEFFVRYPIQPIDECLHILGKRELCVIPELLKELKQEEFSYSERCSKSSLHPVQLLGILRQQLHGMQVTWPYQQDVKWLSLGGEVEGLQLTRGKAVDRVSSSKFCRSNLLRVFCEVCRVARGAPERSWETAEERAERLLPGRDWQAARVVDCGCLQQSCVVAGQEEAKRQSLGAIVGAMQELREGGDLLLLGYPLLTQFSVAIVYMLCRAFHQVGFVRPRQRDSALLFCNLRRGAADYRSILEQIAEELRRMDLSQSVLSVLPINRLCGVSSFNANLVGSRLSEVDTDEYSMSVDQDFYLCVVNMNHVTIAEQIEDIVCHASAS